MLISTKKLIHLPVFTQSGVNLGRIAELVVNVDTQQVDQYVVKSSHIIDEILAKELVISSSQVISITSERVIVEELDNLEEIENSKRILSKDSVTSASI